MAEFKSIFESLRFYVGDDQYQFSKGRFITKEKPLINVLKTLKYVEEMEEETGSKEEKQEPFQLCKGKTQAGKPCKRPAEKGSTLCSAHKE